MSEYAFKEIVEEGNNLGVHTNQLKKIKIVDDKLEAWKTSVDELLMSIARDEFQGKPLTEHESKIYEAFLTSFWLPTFHTKTELLRRLLLLSREHSEFI